MRWITRRDLPYLAIFAAITIWAFVVQEMSILAFATIVIIAAPLGMAIYLFKKKVGLIPPPDDTERR